jgi:hypothetical protein
MAPPGRLAQETAAPQGRPDIEQDGMRMTPLNKQDVPGVDDAVRPRGRLAQRRAP